MRLQQGRASLPRATSAQLTMMLLFCCRQAAIGWMWAATAPLAAGTWSADPTEGASAQHGPYPPCTPCPPFRYLNFPALPIGAHSPPLLSPSVRTTGSLLPCVCLHCLLSQGSLLANSNWVPPRYSPYCSDSDCAEAYRAMPC